jgi:DNA-binding MarR family transcriptional regulator
MPGSLDELEQLLFRIARTVYVTRIEAYAEGAPIDRAGMAVLGRLGATPDLRLSDLAVELNLDVSTVSRQARALEESGLLERLPDPDDRRAARLRLTPEGRRVVEEVRRARRDLLARALSGWSSTDRATLTRLMARLADDLGPDLRCRTDRPEASAARAATPQPRLERSQP